MDRVTRGWTSSIDLKDVDAAAHERFSRLFDDWCEGSFSELLSFITQQSLTEFSPGIEERQRRSLKLNRGSEAQAEASENVSEIPDLVSEHDITMGSSPDTANSGPVLVPAPPVLPDAQIAMTINESVPGLINNESPATSRRRETDTSDSAPSKNLRHQRERIKHRVQVPTHCASYIACVKGALLASNGKDGSKLKADSTTQLARLYTEFEEVLGFPSKNVRCSFQSTMYTTLTIIRTLIIHSPLKADRLSSTIGSKDRARSPSPKRRKVC